MSYGMFVLTMIAGNFLWQVISGIVTGKWNWYIAIDRSVFAPITAAIAVAAHVHF